MKLEFIPRTELSGYNWDPEVKRWNRPDLGPGVLKELSQRSTINGLIRTGAFFALLLGSAWTTIAAFGINPWLAIPFLYIYYFFYGFLVSIGHELQHKTVFAKSFDGFSELIFFVVQLLMWNSPRYARISHQLHHRYTMIHGMDPETPWPEVITSSWLKKNLTEQISRILVVRAIYDLLFIFIPNNIKRSLGIKDKMMQNHCNEKDIKTIRLESSVILLVQFTIAAVAIYFHLWWVLLFVTIAWQIGSPIEEFWHSTEHIGRLNNVNDQRLATRSVKVGPLVWLIYFGLDDHIDHHHFPGIPSRNLPKLHKILQHDLPEPRGVIGCWQEMFAIAREKDINPENEYVPEKMSTN